MKPKDGEPGIYVYPIGTRVIINTCRERDDELIGRVLAIIIEDHNAPQYRVGYFDPDYHIDCFPAFLLKLHDPEATPLHKIGFANGHDSQQST